MQATESCPPPKPAAMKVQLENIPDELRRLDQFVGWKWKWNGRKWDKPPLQVSGSLARSNDPGTWSSYDEIVSSLSCFDGIGFVLPAEDIVVVDLDDCRDPKTGETSDFARSVVERFDTYTEVSPGGCGYKLWCRGTIPAKNKKSCHDTHGMGVELFRGGQYACLTGHVVPGVYPSIRQTQDAIDWLWCEVFRQRNDVDLSGLPRGEAKSDVDIARSVLPAIPKAFADGYHDWVMVGMALRSVGNELLDDWIQWSLQSDKFSGADECRSKWATFHGDGYSLGTLVHHARQNGWGGSVSPGQVSSVLSAPWDEPEPIKWALPDVEPFNSSLLPLALRGWIDDIAERMQCPPDFTAVAAMVAMASLVGNQVAIRPKQYDDWTCVPNLWGMVVGRPSVMKSPALDEAMKIIKQFEIEEKQRFDEESAQDEVEQLIASAQSKKLKRDIEQKIKGGFVDDAREIAEQLVAAPDVRPRRRFVTNNSTVEALHKLLADNPVGILVFRDELYGLLSRCDKEEHQEDRAFFLEAWAGTGRFAVDRIMRGNVEAESIVISLLGAIQPSKLEAYVTQAREGGKGDDGLIQRFQLAVYPDVSKEFRNVDRWPDTEYKRRAREMYRRLVTIDLAEAECDDDLPYVRFGYEAQGVFDEWRVGLENRLRSDELPPHLESHLAKYRSLVPSIALLLEIADFGARCVTRDSVETAIRWARYLESHAHRIYGSWNIGPALNAKTIIEWIEEGRLKDGFSLRDVYRPQRSGLTTKEEAKAAVEVLEDHGYVRKIDPPKSRGVSRASATYEINPRFFGNAPDKH